MKRRRNVKGKQDRTYAANDSVLVKDEANNYLLATTSDVEKNYTLMNELKSAGILLGRCHRSSLSSISD